MKRFLTIALLLASFVLFSNEAAYPKSAIIGFTALNGGGTGALDAVECEDILGDGTNRAIATGDAAIGNVSGVVYHYRYNATGVSAESSPLIIVPDDRADCSSQGQWELSEVSVKSTPNFAVISPTNGMTFFPKFGRVMNMASVGCLIDPADSAESVVINIYECDSNGDSCNTVLSAPITCGNTPTAGTLSDNSWGANNFMKVTIGTVTGTVNSLTIYGVGRE